MRPALRLPFVGRFSKQSSARVPTYEPDVYWERRARELIRTYDRPETWPERGWMRAGVEEETVPRLLSDAGCESVLVPGAGSGRQYRFLLDAGFVPRGFDISERLARECRARFPEVSTWVGDVVDAHRHSEPADAVVTSAVLQHVAPEHITDAVQSLKGLAIKVIVIRETTSLSSPSTYQFAHDYSELFGDCTQIFRAVTDQRDTATVELIAWSI